MAQWPAEAGAGHRGISVARGRLEMTLTLDPRDHVAVARDDDLAERAVHLHVVDEDPPEVRHRDVLEFESRLGVA